MPSRSSLSVTSLRSMPASARAARSALGSSAPVAPLHAALGARGLERRHRHRVDRVRRHQAPHVQRRGVGRVLDAGRSPQRALDGRARLAQRGEALALEDALVGGVRGPRVRQAGATLKLGVARGLQALVDLGVHARDEEGRDRMPVQRQALGLTALEALDVGLHDRLVGLHREQQRHVDVQAVVDRLLDRRDARLGGRDLDHQVRAVDRLPVLVRLRRSCARCRARGPGRPPRTRSRRTRSCGRRRGAGRRRRPARPAAPARGRSRRSSCLRRRGAGRRRRSRPRRGGLLEDRGVGGHALQRVLLDHPRQLAGLDQPAGEAVEPDGCSSRGQRGETLIHCGCAHMTHDT